MICYMYAYCETITKAGLVNAPITPHSYHFVSVVRTFKIYLLSNSQVYNTVLLITVVLVL